ncbi:MAG: GNAT family N-acetyltransferase [Gammaproteobacteria bacterium]|nr:GNAT family N-acetyltransferase [Gammaproteobacteria bacterium]
MSIVTLTKLEENDILEFVLDNQEAFKYGALEEFGKRDEHLEEDGEIISKDTIIRSIEEGEAYRIREDGIIVGGLVLKINKETNHNELELLFIKPSCHSRGIGYKAWLQVEKLYPDTIVWETCTPYFEKRNIHFYVNKCGFKIVEFYCNFHKDPNGVYEVDEDDEMFRFEKRMK